MVGFTTNCEELYEVVRANERYVTEALVLLIALTPASEELQKLVAFENAFDIIFSLIEAEGSLTYGTEVVEDCLSLLAHLLRFNVSNQSYFRETGCIKNVTKLLADCQQEPEDEPPAPQWTLLHRDKNVWGLLAIVQLFLTRGSMSTPINQTAFWQNGVTEQVLSIAFGQKFSVNVTAKVRRDAVLYSVKLTKVGFVRMCRSHPWKLATAGTFRRY